MNVISDIFSQSLFSGTALTDNVNVVPNTYGRLNELGIFKPVPIPTTTASIEISNGVLNVLPTKQLGEAPSFGIIVKRRAEKFDFPQIPHADAVLVRDVQNMIAWAQGGISQAVLETVLGYVNVKLLTMRNKHAITLENLRMGALKGVILDYDGSVILDLFARFGVTQQVVDFLFGAAGTDVGSICDDLVGTMEDNLLGDTMTSVHCLASPTFMKRLLAHQSVKTAYNFFNQANGLNPQRDNVRTMFPFHGIMFEQYRGYTYTLNEDGTRTKVPFVPDGDARFFPMGTNETFVNYWSPPDFLGEENEAPAPGSEIFVAPLEPMKYGKGVEIYTESNPLPLVKRPQLLVRGTSSN